MKRLVLIDGNAILHRAYHALPPLTAPDGSLVNAVYGFTAMILRIFKDLQPTHIAVCFDRPTPTFRKKMFKGYQAKRPKMDEELSGQIEKVHEVVRSFGLPVFEKDGFEADDVIGTLCRKAQNSKFKNQNTSKIQNSNEQKIDQVVIVTGDKDILQLVNDKVFVYMPTKGLSEAKLYKEKDVIERLGVDPAHVADYKGFAGDNSDNYPGVTGIGPKTAIALIDAFGSVEGVYNAIKKNDKKLNKLSDSVMAKLKNGEKSARLSKDLATIRTNVKLDESLDNAEIHTLDTPDARKILSALHFHSLLKRLTGDEKKVIHNEKEKVTKTGEPFGKAQGQQQELF
jgi:5'-3' exonuclease